MNRGTVLSQLRIDPTLSYAITKVQEKYNGLKINGKFCSRLNSLFYWQGTNKHIIIKGKVVPLQAWTGLEGGYPFVTSVLEGMGGKRHAPAALPPGKTRYPLYRRLGRPQGRSGSVRKIALPPGFFFDPRTVQPVASRYTDWATRLKAYNNTTTNTINNNILSSVSPYDSNLYAYFY
jgi:hypothetical protein